MKRKLLSICSLILLIAMMAVACSDGNNAVAEVTEPVEEETTSAKETTARETTTPYEPATIPKEDDGNLAKTETPAIIDIVNVSPDMVCVAGKCEMDAVIIVRGGKDDVMFNADKNYFMGTVELLKDSTVDLQVTAKAPGKAESEPVSVQAKYRSYARQIRTDAYEVVVGGDSQGHFVSSIPYYEGTNLLEEAQITSLASRIKTRVEWLDQNMNGAELIYVLIPTSMTLYPETVPSKYVKTTEPNRLDQYIKGLTDGGATVIDLRDVMVAHKTDDLKLFHKTDSHWTEYGAWIAYCELMNHIAKKWEAAKPRTFEEMGFYEKEVEGGDMPYYLEIDYKKYKEIATFSNPSFKTPSDLMYYLDDNSLLMNHGTTPKYADIKSNNSSLPNAYIMRDSYGIALYNMLCERFNRTVYAAMWSYGFDQDAIKAANANYVIYIVSERSIADVMF